MSKRNQYTDPLSAGVNMAQGGLENEVGIRNEHDDDADLFRSLGDIAGPKPRGAAALLSGVAKGLEYGARSKSTAKKRESLDKYNRVMDYFRTMNNQMMERKQWYETRDFAQKKYLPQVLTYAQNVNTLDPQSRRMMLGDILDGYNQTVGEDFKLASIDGSNPFIVTVQGKKGAQVIDIRNLFNNDENAQVLLNSQMPEFLKKQQEERAQKTFDNQMKERQVAVLENKYGKHGKGNADNEFGSTPISVLQGRGGAPFVATANAEMGIAKEVPIVLEMLDEAEDIIKNNPSLGSGWVNLVGSTDVSKGLLDNKTRVAYEKLNKIANRVAETYIRAKGSAISDSERETIKKGLFDVTNLSGSNQYNINSVRKELGIAKERGDFTGDQISKGFIPTPRSFERYKQSRQNQQLSATNETKIMIKTPDGTTIRIPESYLDQAIANGAEVIG